MVDESNPPQKKPFKDTKAVSLRLKVALILEIDEFVRNGNYKDRSEFMAAAAREQMRREKNDD